MKPEVRYTRSGEVHIAYQIVGQGLRNLVFVPGFLAHLDFQWEEPSQATFFRRLASFRLLIRFDKRGTGLSDRDISVPTLEDRVDDLLAFMGEAEVRSAALMGLSEGGPLSVAFAAMNPKRVEALVLWNSYATLLRCDDHPWGYTPEEIEHFMTLWHQIWGRGEQVNLFAADAAAVDPSFCSW
jgi:pimeloyl-ACP methyl ester carboxylesterase